MEIKDGVFDIWSEFFGILLISNELCLNIDYTTGKESLMRSDN